MNFEERLQKAIDRGTDRRGAQADQAKSAALSEDELKRLHSNHRLELSEHIEECTTKLVNHFPGFQSETIYGDRGWGVAISRDDFNLNKSGQRDNSYSRLEVTIRPFESYHVVDLAAKGTIRNKEVFNRNHFEKIEDVDLTTYREMIDVWVLEFAELYAANST